MNNQTDFERRRMEIYRAELLERMSRAVTEDKVSEVFPGLFIARSSKITQKLHSVYTPAFCVIAQGSKELLLNEEVFHYDHGKISDYDD